MGFADQYLKKQKDSIPRIKSAPQNDLRYAVVIPCYYENRLIDSLESLNNCVRPKGTVEIIVVINSSVNADDSIKEQNLQTYKEATDWIKDHSDSKFCYHIIYVPDLSPKYAGAGYARKIGMDEAVWRFNLIRKDSGIIVSFDADSICDNNYLTEIENYYNEYPFANGSSIYFEHPLSGDDFSDSVYRAIALYELHLRYYIQALRNISFPYAFHTVGACFTVKALSYIKQGGMNKRKAGEDFYFLHKIIPLGNYADVNSTRVIPSPRPSHRVPFGTGPAIKKFLLDSEAEFMTYNPESFRDLRELFNIVPEFFKQNQEYIKDKIKELPVPVKEFLNENKAVYKINEINNNCNNINSFTRRFYNWFNAFTVLKFLNFCSSNYYPRISVVSATNILLKRLELLDYKNSNEFELLKLLRQHEKNQRYYTNILLTGK
jgi:hypothetical protein